MIFQKYAWEECIALRQAVERMLANKLSQSNSAVDPVEQTISHKEPEKVQHETTSIKELEPSSYSKSLSPSSSKDKRMNAKSKKSPSNSSFEFQKHQNNNKNITSRTDKPNSTPFWPCPRKFRIYPMHPPAAAGSCRRQVLI